MRCTPIESTAVTTAGRPSGTAATARATPRMSTSKSALTPRTSSTTTMVTIMTTAIATTTMPSSLPVRSSSRCNGVVSSGVALSSPAMRPISVCMPVAVTTALPCPYVAAVPLKTMLSRSPRGTSSEIGAIPFVTGTLSPVSAASAVCSAADSIRRPSAGMVSPSSMRTMSPGTTCEAGTLRRVPPRITVASAADIARSAATAAAARDAWMWPIIAFNSTTARMAIASYGRAASRSTTQRAAETPVAMRSRMTRTSWNCDRSLRQAGTASSAASSFGPYRASRARASSSPSPRRSSVRSDGDQLAGVLPVRTTGLWRFAGDGRHIGQPDESRGFHHRGEHAETVRRCTRLLRASMANVLADSAYAVTLGLNLGAGTPLARGSAPASQRRGRQLGNHPCRRTLAFSFSFHAREAGHAVHWHQRLHRRGRVVGRSLYRKRKAAEASRAALVVDQPRPLGGFEGV